MMRPDFDGTLTDRMNQLNSIVYDLDDVIIVGSSFGGLMGTCLCRQQPDKVRRLIMLAPALNFGEFHAPEQKINVASLLVIGKNDVVTPPDLVIPAAEATFSHLKINLVEDDHLLHNFFYKMDWPTLLA